MLVSLADCLRLKCNAQSYVQLLETNNNRVGHPKATTPREGPYLLHKGVTDDQLSREFYAITGILISRVTVSRLHNTDKKVYGIE
ncbi:hypothetical protein TNCV_2405671 [Trichonephila clavipes]|nr:hypothetical protein TNCV_2405671 [Trichonephila clavipes]